LLHIMLFCVNARPCYDISNLANARASDAHISTDVLITSYVNQPYVSVAIIAVPAA